jgi:hypothetical protein
VSKPTHIVKLREGKAPASEVTSEELAQMEKTLVGFKANYDVTPIEQAEKPAPLAKPGKPEAGDAATSEKSK